jgi:hypothetical protein
MQRWGDALAQQERYKDFLREAEQYRLVRPALAGSDRHAGFHRRVLTWLGGRLVAWGWRLQERYGVGAAVPALRVANCCR